MPALAVHLHPELRQGALDCGLNFVEALSGIVLQAKVHGSQESAPAFGMFYGVRKIKMRPEGA